MNVVLDQLLAISERLECPSGVSPSELANLRVFLTASLIQQNPGAGLIQPDPTIDAAFNEAAAKGAILASKLAETGTSLRVLRDSYASPSLTPDHPKQIFGPFVDADGTLVQFAAFESAAFLSVQLTLPPPLPLFTEVIMLLPLETSSNDAQTFNIPAGTVWLRARFVVSNTAGHLGLRVKKGLLRIDGVAQQIAANRIAVPVTASWSLVLDPEQAAAADGNGSDANNLTVQLPRRLEVLSTGETRVNGEIKISGFGTDLEFNPSQGPPQANQDSIAFPYEATDSPWSINGNFSKVAQFTGKCRTLSAAWILPLNKLPLNTIGKAANGGQLELRLRGEIESRLAGAAGSFTWFDTILTASDEGIALETRQAKSSARTELDLWTPAHTEGVFAQQSIGRLRYCSYRNGRDVALVSGGQIRNRWDLPLTAAGKPFAYIGQNELFAVIAERTGQLRITSIAVQQPDGRSYGVALENLYLVVQAPRRLSLTGDYDGQLTVAGGTAVYFFHVTLAQPSLPDPYVANWSVSDEGFISEAALSIRMNWTNSQAPTTDAQLERPVNFPQPAEGPEDEPQTLRDLFNEFLKSQSGPLNLLDLSTNDHLLGVALEKRSAMPVKIKENRLTVPLRHVRLLMQPQVQWEPVEVVPNPDAGVPHADTLVFKTNGARTLAGTTSLELVPVLPGIISAGFVTAASKKFGCGALFSLPFGLRAFARIDPVFEDAGFLFQPAILTTLHEPEFGELTSARQLRLVASGSFNNDPSKDPASRSMTGRIVQLTNLETNKNKLASVLSDGIREDGTPLVDTIIPHLDGLGSGELPLHHADLSGYGLSTFSDWRRSVPTGITKVRFDVLSGRTSYEVIQAKTILAFPMCYVVRTIIFERRNSAKVLRFDSGWKPVNDGMFKVEFPGAPSNPDKNFEFEKGVVKAFRNIRRIRVLPNPSVDVGTWKWQPVIFDAEAHLENVVAGGSGELVPIYDHPGYIQLLPTGLGSEVTRTSIQDLLKRIGKPVGGGIDCKIRVGGTLEMHLSGIFADEAPNDAGSNIALMLGAYGLPKLPRAAQWSAVRINATTSEASPVDPRHGMPVIRRTSQPTYIFRDPGDANRSKPDEFGLLMSTATSRVLFPKPSISPAEIGLLRTEKPNVADPYSLAQSTSQFPRPTYALRCAQSALLRISADNHWRIDNPSFFFTQPALDLAKGGDWAVKRAFPGANELKLALDSLNQNQPWDIGVTPNDLNLDIAGLGTIFVIHTNYHALSGALPKLEEPTLDFGWALKEVQDIVNSLKHFKVLSKFSFDVDVAAGTGPSPSFIVRIGMKIRVGEGPNERIDIGVGKFYGEFRVRGELEAALSGKTRGLLAAEFQGDVQQGIIPPAIYAGGMFRFAIQIDETGKPLIELGLGCTASIGGDLIKGLVEVEVTVKYGYTLIPQTLQPAVLLGLEARAKLLSGLLGFSFSVEAMARLKRLDIDRNQIEIWAQIRVAATAQVAWLIEEEIDFETQFEQRLPLALTVAALFGPALLPAAAALDA